MNIGSVKPYKTGYMGEVATVTLDMVVALVPVASNSPNAPKFEVQARNVAKRFVRIGAVWEKARNTTGEAYLSGHIDDPSFAEKIYIAGFYQDDESISIVWSRPERQDGIKDRRSADGVPAPFAQMEDAHHPGGTYNDDTVPF